MSAKEPSAEEQLQSLLIEARTMEAYLNEIATREAIVSRAMTENKLALEAIKGISENQNNDVLFPVGGGIYLKTNSINGEKVIASIGANAAVEKTPAEALNFVEERLRELETTISALQTQKADLTNKLNYAKAVLSRLIEQRRSG